MHRTRWSAIGAAVAVAIGGGGLLGASAESSASGSLFTAIAPCRILDTRASSTVGPRGAALGPAETYSIQTKGTNGNCSLPTTITALALNVTAVGPTAESYLTVFPAGGTVPTASNLNFVGNQAPVPNAVTVAVADDGRVSFYNNGGKVDVIADVVGYFTGANFDDRYYTKTETDTKLADVDADISAVEDEIDALPAPTPGGPAYSDYAAADYIVTSDGCAAHQARLDVADEWGTAGTFPDLPCVTMPVWTDFVNQISTPATWTAPLAGLPAGVERFDDSGFSFTAQAGPAVGPSVQCAVVLVAAQPNVQCSFGGPFPVPAYPYDTIAAVGSVTSPLTLLQRNPPNP